jgi:hypothetical protein
MAKKKTKRKSISRNSTNKGNMLSKNKLIAISLIALLGVVGIFTFLGNDMLGVDSEVLNFESEDGEDVADGAMSAYLGAYDKDGNLIKEGGASMSGFMLDGIEVGFMTFSITTVVSGLNVNWSTFEYEWKLAVYPNVNDTIKMAGGTWGGIVEIGNRIMLDGYVIFPNGTIYDDSDWRYVIVDGCSLVFNFVIWDYDAFLESDGYTDDYNWEANYLFLEEALGAPISGNETTGEYGYLLQMNFDIVYTVYDFEWGKLGCGAYVVGIWQLTKLFGTLSMTINDELSIEDFDPALLLLIAGRELKDIVKSITPVVDIYPKDKTEIFD